MSTVSIRCLKAAIIAMVCGITLGASFALDRSLGATWRPLHAELNIWGWATLLIYGMGYHMLPRFCAKPLQHTLLVELQSWLAIGGVFVVVVGWLLEPFAPAVALPVRAIGGLSQLGAALLFAVLVSELLWPVARHHRVRARASEEQKSKGTREQSALLPASDQRSASANQPLRTE